MNVRSTILRICYKIIEMGFVCVSQVESVHMGDYYKVSSYIKA
jgi:hypothetical protein